MNLRQTHTYVTLEVSSKCFNEILAKLNQAHYQHCIWPNEDGSTTIDMQGIALEEKKKVKKKKKEIRYA